MAQSGFLQSSNLPVVGAHQQVLQAVDGGQLTVPGDAWLLKADFSPQGGDLLLTGPDGAQVLIRDFYNVDNPPDLLTDSGAMISGDLASALAGPVAPGQSALVEGSPFSQLAQAAESIGRVEATDGLVEAIRIDGTKVTLAKGDDIFQGDTLVTAKGAAVGITFIDDTTFSLGEEGRMVIDEMVYDAEAQEGQFSANLVQGVFSFVSGNIAKTSPDGMTVTTPVATIGIRGTKVAGHADQEGSQNTISLLPELDAQGVPFVGELSVTNEGGTVTLNAIGATVQMSSAFQAPPTPVTFTQQQIQQSFGAALTTLSTTAAAAADAAAQENTAEAEAAQAEADQAGAEAETAQAEADQAAAEAAQAQADAEASGDPEAIAAADAKTAEADALAAEADAKTAEAEAKVAEADVAKAEADVTQAAAVQANSEMQAQVQAFQTFGGPAAGGEPADAPPANAPPPDAPPADAGPAPDGGQQPDTGGETFNGDSTFGGGDTLFGSGDTLFGTGDPLFGDGGNDQFSDPLPVGDGALLTFVDVAETDLPPPLEAPTDLPPPPPPPLVNTSPTLANALVDQTVGTNTALSYQLDAAAFSDADGDPLTYSATLADGTALPAWLSFDSATQTFSGTSPLVGNISIKVEASDGAAVVSDTFTIATNNIAVVGGINFNSVSNYTTTASYYDGEIVDVNNDGYNDLLMLSNAPTQKVQVRLNDGAGNLGAETDVFVGAVGSNIEATDLTGDGNIDFVLTTGQIFLGNGDGTFNEVASAFNPGSKLELADVDGDGDKDIITADNGGKRIYLNDGTGTLTDSGQMFGLANSSAFATNDFDGDGDLDLITANGGGTFEIWENSGGVFSAAGTLSLVDGDMNTGAVHAIELGDFNGDGDTDLWLTNRYAKHMLYENDGSGNLTFTKTGEFSLGLSGANDREGSDVGDIDGDGDLDVVVAVWESGATDEFWINDGSGNFTDANAGGALGVGTHSGQSVAIGDISGDGLDDVFLAHSGQNSEVLINTTATLEIVKATEEFLVNTTTAGSQQAPQMIATKGGGYVIVFENSDTYGFGIFGQRYDVSGNKLGTEFQINTTDTATVTEQHLSDYQKLTGLANGGFVVSWHSYQQDAVDGGWAAMTRIYDATGTAVTGEIQLNTYTANEQAHITVIQLTGGDLIHAWQSLGQDATATYGIYAQRMTAEGVKVGTEFLMNTTVASNQYQPTIVALNNGGFAAYWSSNGQAGGNATYEVIGQIYDSTATKVNGEFMVNTTTADQQYWSQAIELNSGNMVVAWYSLNQDGSAGSAYARIFNASGGPVSTEFQMNTTTLNEQGAPYLVALTGGGFVATWHDNSSGTSYNITAQMFDAAGVKVGTEFTANTYNTGDQTWPSIDALEDGGFVISWMSLGQDVAATNGVYAQRYDASGNAIGTTTLTGSAGNESIVLDAAVTATHIDLAGGTDSLTLADATNSVSVSNTETITGGTGNDYVSMSTAQASGSVDLGAGTDVLRLADGGNTLSVSNTETIYGGTGDDTLALNGSTVGAELYGFGGNDSFTLSSGASLSGTIDGGAGTDSVALTDGNNIVTVKNVETITGGSGNDTVTLSSTGPASFLTFDGVDDYVLLPDATINNIATGTIEMWVRAADLNSASVLMTMQDDTFNTMGTLGLGGPGGDANTSTKVGALSWHGQNGVTTAVSAGSLTAGTWNHVAVSFSATQVSFYINGVLDSTIAGNYSIPNDVNAGVITSIGDMRVSGASYSPFGGDLSSINVWGATRTEAEINSSMNGDLGVTTDLVASWDMDTGTGTTVIDNSTNGFNGTITNQTPSAETWGADNVSISNVETITGSSGGDYVTLATAQSSGDVDLGAGADTLKLADGGNTINVTNTETIVGGTGDDTINVSGSVGARITGGFGNDTLNGGSGVDTFVYTATSLNSGDMLSTAIDTTNATGGDIIDMTGTMESLLTSGGTLLSALGVNTTLGTALNASNSIALVDAGAGDMQIHIDNNADSIVDFTIDVANAVTSATYDSTADHIVLS